MSYRALKSNGSENGETLEIIKVVTVEENRFFSLRRLWTGLSRMLKYRNSQEADSSYAICESVAGPGSATKSLIAAVESGINERRSLKVLLVSSQWELCVM